MPCLISYHIYDLVRHMAKSALFKLTGVDSMQRLRLPNGVSDLILVAENGVALHRPEANAFATASVSPANAILRPFSHACQ